MFHQKRKEQNPKGKNTPKELYKKELHDLDNHDSVITHIELNILECKVKCA